MKHITFCEYLGDGDYEVIVDLDYKSSKDVLTCFNSAEIGLNSFLLTTVDLLCLAEYWRDHQNPDRLFDCVMMMYYLKLGKKLYCIVNDDSDMNDDRNRYEGVPHE